MIFKPIILPHGSVEAEALRCERDAVVAEFKAMTFALMKMRGWTEGTAMLVTERLILAYDIGAEAREAGGRGVGERPAAPPEAVARLCREVYALTGDMRAAALVERAFLIGWKRNKRSDGGAPEKTAGATVIELMRRTGKDYDDTRARWRMPKRLEKMVKEFMSRSP